MVQIILSGHGQISTGVKSATDMIFGAQDNYTAVEFLPGEGKENLSEKFKALLDDFDPTEEVLIIVDVFGGTPYNTASELVYGNSNRDVITGLSLPLVLEALSARLSGNLVEVVAHLKNASPDFVKIFSEEFAKIQSVSEDLEEDEL